MGLIGMGLIHLPLINRITAHLLIYAVHISQYLGLSVYRNLVEIFYVEGVFHNKGSIRPQIIFQI